MSDEPDDDLSDVLRNLRLDGHFRFKTGVYRRLEEQDDARQALIGLGIRVTDFRQAERGDDPPDSTCRVDGKLWGIEVTELLHDAVMKERLRGDHGRHHEWTDSEIIAALSKRIAEKDQAKPKGGPYERYLLVIRTEELHMELPRMGPILQNYRAQCTLITDACLAYSYHPHDDDPDRPDYPALRIKIAKRV